MIISKRSKMVYQNVCNCFSKKKKKLCVIKACAICFSKKQKMSVLKYSVSIEKLKRTPKRYSRLLKKKI